MIMLKLIFFSKEKFPLYKNEPSETLVEFPSVVNNDIVIVVLLWVKRTKYFHIQ